jgi:hypothetical protein
LQADWTFILPLEVTAKELRHLPKNTPPQAYYQTSQYVTPRGGIFLGKWYSAFTGTSDGKMNVQSGCALNILYNAFRNYFYGIGNSRRIRSSHFLTWECLHMTPAILNHAPLHPPTSPDPTRNSCIVIQARPLTYPDDRDSLQCVQLADWDVT